MKPEPAHRTSARAFFDRLEGRIAASALSERAAVRAAGAVGMLRNALSRRWPAAADMTALYGTPTLASCRIALEVAALEAKNRLVLNRVGGRPLAPFAPLVRWRDRDAAGRLEPRTILVTGHLGAQHLLALALDQLGIRRTTVRWSPWHEVGNAERNAVVAGGLGTRTRALLDAIAEIEAGGHVVTTIDGGYGAAVPVRVFGRHLDLGLGAFVIAKRTGARIVPLSASWEGSRVVCDLGKAIETPEEAAAWLESHLRSAPDQISLALLRRLLLGPPDGTAVADARGVELAVGEPPAELEMP